MSRTYTLRRQHNALEELAGQVTYAMHSIETLEDAMECSRKLAKLTGVLQFHLAAEDKSLYPRMKASPDPAVARTASEFAKDMGGLADAYAEFVGNWPTGISIFENPEAFRTEAELVLSILTRRIERENQVLYPLADTMISVGQIDLNQTTT